MVNIEACAKVASSLVNKLVSMQNQVDACSRIEMIRNLDEYHMVIGLNQQTFGDALSTALLAADTKQSGYLHRNTIFEAISGALPALNPKQMQAMLSLAMSENDGFASYQPIIDRSFQVLQFMQEQELLQKV